MRIRPSLESVYRVGQVVFQGQGWVRSVYFALLLILAIVIVALILIKLRSGLAWLEKVDKHRLIARRTLAAVVPRLHHRHEHLV